MEAPRRLSRRTPETLVLLSLVTGALLSVVGCDDPGETTTTTGVGSTSSSSGEGGSGGASTSSSSSSGEGGSGGSVGTSSSSGTGGPDPCIPNTVHLEGMLDATSVKGDFSKGSIGGSEVLNVNFGSGGMIRVKGAKGTLRMPDDGPEPGVWFATGAGTKATEINGHSGFTLKGLKRLGTCAAATGMGDLAFCYDSGGSCPGGVIPTTTTGTVNGTAFDWGGHANFDLTGTLAGPVVLWKNGAALFGQPTSGSSTQLVNGILWTPSGAPDAGAFWCVVKGSYTSFGGAKKANVTEMKRLGTYADSPAVTGQIDGCY